VEIESRSIGREGRVVVGWGGVGGVERRSRQIIYVKDVVRGWRCGGDGGGGVGEQRRG
jgi:hypothetical protein